MALGTNTTTKYDLTGIREDLEDVIWDISPTETPVVSSIDKVSVSQTTHEWQTDSLAAASTNAQLEGDDTDATAVSATAKVANYTQILKEVILTSRTSDRVNKAGRGEEHAYQLAKAGRKLKRDLEYSVSRNQAAVAGSEATARQMASVETWLKTNKSYATIGGTTPGTSSGAPTTAPTDGTQRTFTEALLKSVIADAWDAGGDPSMIVTGPVNKQTLSGFAGIATQYRDNQQKGPATIIAAADIYVSDFGEHTVVPSRFSRDRTVLLLDPEMWALGTFDPFKQERLAKTGDNKKSHIVGEYTLICRNEAASGKVADLLTS